jgi:hypothetical protein
LLRKWRIPPGLGEDGSFDGENLRSWLEIVREECGETGHLEIAMILVGHVLTYVPTDPDGLWIHRSAAEILNERDAQNMRSGFHTELYNSRGVHWIDPTGKPERELAAKYRERAESLDNAGYHRLATTIRELADTYVYESQQVSRKEDLLTR